MLTDFIRDLPILFDKLEVFGWTAAQISPLGTAAVCAGALLALHPIRHKVIDMETPIPVKMRRIIVSLTHNQLLYTGVMLVIGQAILQGLLPAAMLLAVVAFTALSLSQTKQAIFLLAYDRIVREKSQEPGYFDAHPADRLGVHLVSLLPVAAIGYCAVQAIILVSSA